MNKKIMNRNIMHKLSQNSNLIFCACISFRTSTLNVCHMMILLHRYILAKKDYSFSNNVVGLSWFFFLKKKSEVHRISYAYGNLEKEFGAKNINIETFGGS